MLLPVLTKAPSNALIGIPSPEPENTDLLTIDDESWVVLTCRAGITPLYWAAY